MQNSVKLMIGAVVAGIIGLVVWWQMQPVQKPESVVGTVAEPVAVAPESAPEAVPDPEPQHQAANTAPQFDVVRVSPEGQAVIAGQAAPGQMVEILLDGTVIGTAAADATGSFATVLEVAPSNEARELTLRTALAEAPAAVVALAPTAGAGDATSDQPVSSEAATPETVTTEAAAAAAAELAAAEKAAEAAAAAELAAAEIAAELAAAEKAAEAAAEQAAAELTAAAAKAEAEALAAAELTAAAAKAEAEALAAAEADAAVKAEAEALAAAEAAAAAKAEAEALAAAEAAAAAKAEAEALAAAEAAAAAKAEAEALAAAEAAAAAKAEAEALAAAEAAAAMAAADPAADSLEPEVSRFAMSAPVIILPQEGADQAPVLLKAEPEGVVLLQPAQTEPTAGIVLDRITYSPEGDLMAAGRGQPGAIVRVYANAKFLEEIRCNEDGRWEARIGSDIATKAVLLRFDEVDDGGAVLSRLETPFEYSPVATTQELRQRKIVVQKGDYLWKFAEQYYGEGWRYSVIFSANSALIRDPDLIYPGQIFSVPELVNSQ
jgi:nucleoid-associated protein YgaU